jgi:hypothetical protein
MHTVQPATAHALAYRVIGDPELPQLRQREHPVLAGRQRRHLDIKPAI